jgi:type I restriction-modification system DNA methylase subunit
MLTPNDTPIKTKGLEIVGVLSQGVICANDLSDHRLRIDNDLTRMRDLRIASPMGSIARDGVRRSKDINFNASDDRHIFGDIYEKIPKDLQSAGNAGEFYTPRAVTKFIVEQMNPQLGEHILDPACGTGGFLTSTIEHLRKQAKTESRRTFHPGLFLRH